MRHIPIILFLLYSLSLFADKDNDLRIKNTNPTQQFEEWFDLFFHYAKNKNWPHEMIVMDKNNKIILDTLRAKPLTSLMTDSIHLTLASVYTINPCYGFVYQDTVQKGESIALILQVLNNINGIVDTSVIILFLIHMGN